MSGQANEVDKVPQFSKEQLKYLEKLLTPKCCHTSGMHDPTHFVEKKYVCLMQKANAYDDFREQLGLGEVTVDDPVPREGCYWCRGKGLIFDLSE